MTATTLPLATVHGLYHIAIKTENLAATRKFWTEIIGLREFPRPDFGYPGAWLGCPQPGGLAIVHVYAGGHIEGDVISETISILIASVLSSFLVVYVLMRRKSPFPGP